MRMFLISRLISQSHIILSQITRPYSHTGNNNIGAKENLHCDDYAAYPGTPSKCTCSYLDIFIPIRLDPSAMPSRSPSPSASPSESSGPSLLGEPSQSPSTVPTLVPSISLQPSFKAERLIAPSPSAAPSEAPSSAPTCFAINQGNFECATFANDGGATIEYSLITKDNTNSAAKNVYKKMFVGGNLQNPGQNTVTVGGHVYYGSLTEPINTNFNGGKTKLSDISSPPLDFEYYEWLATRISAGSYSNGYQVIIEAVPKGSCYNIYDFLGPAAQGTNNGKTLIVFTFSDDICLTKTSDGRQFGPSVLAPFSKVTLTNSGYLDGVLIARSFTTVYDGSIGSEQQLHGVAYSG